MDQWREAAYLMAGTRHWECRFFLKPHRLAYGGEHVPIAVSLPSAPYRSALSFVI